MYTVADPTPDLAESILPHHDELNDEFLLHTLAAGDVSALELLYQRYSTLLYSLAYRMIGDHQAAEDLLQDVFLAIWRRAASYSPEAGSVRSWLASIMHHRAVDHIRSMHRRCISKQIALDEVERDEDVALPDTWDEVWHSTQRSLIRECLMTLLPEQRIALELAYFHGLTQAEIAKMCQIPLGTVKGRMRLGLLHLKRELEKRGIAET